MREMAFLPQEYMIFQPHHHTHHLLPHHDRNHHDFDHDQDDHHLDPSISLNILSSCPPQDFPGGGQGMVTLTMMNRSLSFPGYPQDNHNQGEDQENDEAGPEPGQNHQEGGGGAGDELSDDGSQVLVGGGEREKKKRLNMEQVKTLEKNFEQGNKLEPERKVQLAKALGLQPRQVAIWFQNRRARWKTKQLEKDYGVLKRQFDALKADNDSLLTVNKKLQAELIALRDREAGAKYRGNTSINLNNNADIKSYWSNNGSDINSDINQGSSRATPQNPISNISIIQLLINQNPSPNHNNNHDHNNNKPELDLIQCPKLNPPIQDDSFCNVFGGGGGGGAGGDVDQTQSTSFWAWPEQQHLN